MVKHINNIYKSNELDPAATCSKMEQVAADGKKRKMHLYNLDVIISVGYRVNSTKATQFRQWATQRLKNHSFIDGNKRIAAACFLLFLENNALLKSGTGAALISNEALASLTLFAAASKPEEMDTVKKLVISVLNRNQ